MAGKTYLVTGGAGFIGSNFVHYMLGKYDEIRIVNVDALTYAGNLENLAEIANDPRYVFLHADIRDRAAMEQAFAEYDPDYVINFAAESHVDRSIETPEIFADTNVMGTVTLLNVARKKWERGEGDFGDHRYLQVSTDEVYGSLSLDDPTSFFRETTPLNPHSPYSASKASADLFVKAYHDTYGFPSLITRCSNNYGPYQFPEKLIPLMINNALHHEKLPVYGDGLNVRDWLYVEDHCKAIDMVVNGGHIGEVYNVGGHNERPNIFIVKKVIEECSQAVSDPAITEALIEHVTDRKGHDRRYGIAPDKIKADLGWYPETTFEVGIVKTIRWYLDHKEWVEHVTSGAYQDYYREMYAKKQEI
ncbi:dTDP-glucose 4,6-dehydratase [bacterium]|nr:dTDP-glucose 4,6-dehydratase [bacterium]